MVELLFTALFITSVVIVAWVIVYISKKWKQEEPHKIEEERDHFEEEVEQKRKEERRKRSADELRKVEGESEEIGEVTRGKAQKEERSRQEEKETQKRGEKEDAKRRKEGKGKEEPKPAREERQEKAKEMRGQGRQPPHKRGGRPRGSRKHGEIEQTQGVKPRTLKPEIVCWNKGWKWVVGIELPKELETQSVVQNEELLEQDSTDDLCYSLKDAEGTVKVTWIGGQESIPLVGVARSCLIFKMRKNWKGLGRLVRRPTTGYYLVVAPQEWKRDEDVSGHAPVTSESVQPDGYKAHFFYREGNGSLTIGFITTGGERIRVEAESPRFQLVGREISDASDNMGPLFGGQPPFLRALDGKRWSYVGVIVVGEEGTGRNKWRTQFAPKADAEEQMMPDEVTNRCGGWYFVRIYDHDGNLIESMDFRFMFALRDIQKETHASLPGPFGHDSVIIRFVHQTDCKVDVTDEDMRYPVEIRREKGQTTVTILPNPDCDKTLWCLRNKNAEIRVTLLVERIWWTVGTVGVLPTSWTDRLVIVPRKDFVATSDKVLFLRLPHKRWVREIEVGFARASLRTFRVEVEKKEIDIPLRDFCDTKEIENKQDESKMMIWIQHKEPEPDETVVVKVPADQPAIPKQKKQQVQMIFPKEEKDSPPHAIVKCPGTYQPVKLRRGKGFSRRELAEVRLTIHDAKRLHITCDEIRKTSHSWNVESLKNLMGEHKHVHIGA